MAKRRTSVIQVMITGDASDLNKATRQGSDGMGLLGAAAITAAKVVTSALSGIAAFSIREFARFDQAMTQSQAIMGDLSDTTKKAMSDVAREVGVTTTFAAHEAAEAFYFLASAGLTAEQSMASMPRVAAFAQAGMFDLARATDILTDVQSSLGLSSADASENLANMTDISNVLVGITTKANASVEQFGEAFMRAGARIRMVGVPIEEAAAVLGAFADQGTKGAAGGEALSIILRDLPRAADRNAKAFRDLGIRVEDADGKFRPMADIVEDFEKALDGLSATQQSGVFTTLGLTRSVADQLATLVGTSEKIRQYEADLRLMGDVTQEVADKQLQSFSNQMALTRAQFTNIALTIGEALAGPLRAFNLWLREQTPAIEAFVNNAIPKIEEFARKSVAKFREFKAAFQTNVIDPINAFLALPTTVAFFAEFEAEFERFTGRLRNLGADLRAAVDKEDPEAVGMALGEFVAEVFRTAFGRAEVFGEIIMEAFGAQNFRELGIAVGSVATEFFKGFFIGLTKVPVGDDGEIDANARTLAKIFTENFTGTLIAAIILSRVPLIGGIFRLLLKPFTVGFSLLGAKLVGLIPAVLGSKLIGGFVLLLKLLKNTIFLLLTPFAAVIGGMFRTLFALLGGATTLNAMKAAEMIRTFFRTKWATLLRSGLGEAFAILRAFGIRAGIRAIGLILAGLLGAFLGWPGLIFAAAALAFREFIIRFGKWNQEQGDEYEGFGSKIVAFIVEGVKNFAFFQRVKDWFAARVRDLKNMIPSFSTDFEEMGKSMIRGIIAGINLLSGGLSDRLISVVRNAWNAAKDFLGIRSPSKLFESIGVDMMRGLSLGIDESARIVQDAVGVNSAMAANEARRFAELAASQRVSQPAAPSQSTVINVSGALDPEGVARQIAKILRDSDRRVGEVFV